MIYSPLRAVALAALLTATAIPALAVDADPVVATVNGKDIHRSALAKAQQAIAQHGQVSLDKVYDQLLEQEIVGQLVLEQAKKLKLEDDPQFKEMMAEARTEILQQVYLTKRIDADIPESAIKQRYEEVKGKLPVKEEAKVRHILVDSEDAAKAVIADLQGGASFEEEAKAKSKDQSAKAGGDLGYITKGRTVAEFSAAAFSLKSGEYTQVPVKSQFGWHVIKVEDRRVAPPPTYEESKAGIKNELAQQDMHKIIETLEKNAQIKRFKLDGSPAAEKPKT